VLGFRTGLFGAAGGLLITVGIDHPAGLPGRPALWGSGVVGMQPAMRWSPITGPGLTSASGLLVPGRNGGVERGGRRW
jgi:hypothetical protein